MLRKQNKNGDDKTENNTLYFTIPQGTYLRTVTVEP